MMNFDMNQMMQSALSQATNHADSMYKMMEWDYESFDDPKSAASFLNKQNIKAAFPIVWNNKFGVFFVRLNTGSCEKSATVTR